MDDKAIEAPIRSAFDAFAKAVEASGPNGSPYTAMRAAIAAYEAALGPINPGPIADMVNENVRLRAQVERMREALRPFTAFSPNPSSDDDTYCVAYSFKAGDYRAACAAMEE